MPDLDLGNIADVDLSTSGRSSTERAFAGYRLLACMAWPTDEAKREQFLATVTAREIDWLDNLHLVEDSDDRLVELEADFEAARSQVKSDSFESEFQAHGGYGSVAAAPGVEAFRTILETVDARWRAAGTVLYLIMAIAQHHPEIRRGASVNKAVFLMECFVKGSQFPTNRKDLMAAWSAYKKVAHLCAAYVCMTTQISHETEPTRTKFIAGLFSQGLGLLLAHTSQFQIFATSYRVHGRKGPLLKPSEIWTVPSKLQLPIVGPTTSPLSNEMLEALREYRVRAYI